MRIVLLRSLVFLISPVLGKQAGISAKNRTNRPGFLCIYVLWLIEYFPNLIEFLLYLLIPIVSPSDYFPGSSEAVITDKRQWPTGLKDAGATLENG